MNQQLKEYFGIDTESTNSMWRISWAEDQYEKRLTEWTDTGLLLSTPEVRELPKYQWIVNRWILERLVAVPEYQQKELAGSKTSYECMHYFREGMIPSFEACKFLIDLIYSALGKTNMAKYKDSDAKNPLEAQSERVDKLVEELFGDESDLLLRTVTGEAIIVPQTYEKKE